MFQRFKELREQGESGFTLIELLVVILIIAILAAIAIPAFLNQRKKAWVAQQQSALKDAATAAETYGTGTNGDFSGLTANDATVPELKANGYNTTSGVTLTVAAKGTTGYCLKAVGTGGVANMYYDSGIATSTAAGVPSTVNCSTFTY